MTSKKMLVEVELVPVVTSIIAEPGDKLMMLNGLCIGVDTSREGKTPPMPHPALVDESEPAPPPRKVSKRKQARVTPSMRKASSASARIREHILSRLTEEPQDRQALMDGATWATNDYMLFNYVMNVLIRERIVIHPTSRTYAKRPGWTRADIQPSESTPPPSPSPSPPRDMRVVGYSDLKDYGIYKSRDALNAMIKTGEFPPSFRISPGRVAWRTSEIEEWAAKRKRSAA